VVPLFFAFTKKTHFNKYGQQADILSL